MPSFYEQEFYHQEDTPFLQNKISLIVKNSLPSSSIYNKKRKKIRSINLPFLEEDPIPKIKTK